MFRVLALVALLALPSYSECGVRRPVRRIVCHVPVVRNVVKCDCGDKCNCLNCCCDSRRIVQQAAAVVTFPVRVVGSCVGGCCGK